MRGDRRVRSRHALVGGSPWCVRGPPRSLPRLGLLRRFAERRTASLERRRLLTSRALLFPAALVGGLLLGPRLAPLTVLNVPILVVTMTLSLAEIDLAALRNPHLVLRAAAAGIGLNHLLFGAVVLGAGRLLAPDAETWAGIVLVAACPPGVGVVPFTVLLGGDLVLSTVAVAAGFLASLALAPALVALLADGAVLPPSAVARLIATLVVLPAILAAGIRGLGLRGRVRRLHGPVVNVGFAVILATLLGANRPHLFGRPEALVPSLAAAVAGVPLLAIAVRAALRRLGAAHAAGVSLLLLATVKNTFFAASVAYAVAGGPAAVPGVVASAVTISYLMLVERFLPVRAQAAAYTRPR